MVLSFHVHAGVALCLCSLSFRGLILTHTLMLSSNGTAIVRVALTLREEEEPVSASECLVGALILLLVALPEARGLVVPTMLFFGLDANRRLPSTSFSGMPPLRDGVSEEIDEGLNLDGVRMDDGVDVRRIAQQVRDSPTTSLKLFGAWDNIFFCKYFRLLSHLFSIFYFPIFEWVSIKAFFPAVRHGKKYLSPRLRPGCTTVHWAHGNSRSAPPPPTPPAPPPTPSHPVPHQFLFFYHRTRIFDVPVLTPVHPCELWPSGQSSIFVMSCEGSFIILRCPHTEFWTRGFNSAAAAEQQQNSSTLA